MKPRQYLIGRIQADHSPTLASGLSRGIHYDVEVMLDYLVATTDEDADAPHHRFAYHLGRAGFDVPRTVVQHARSLETHHRDCHPDDLSVAERADIFLAAHADWYRRRHLSREVADFCTTVAGLAPWAAVAAALTVIATLDDLATRTQPARDRVAEAVDTATHLTRSGLSALFSGVLPDTDESAESSTDTPAPPDDRPLSVPHEPQSPGSPVADDAPAPQREPAVVTTDERTDDQPEREAESRSDWP